MRGPRCGLSDAPGVRLQGAALERLPSLGDMDTHVDPLLLSGISPALEGLGAIALLSGTHGPHSPGIWTFPGPAKATQPS
jgi:hypothetical protein